MDEPTGNLTPGAPGAILDLVLELHRQKGHHHGPTHVPAIARQADRSLLMAGTGRSSAIRNASLRWVRPWPSPTPSAMPCKQHRPKEAPHAPDP